MAARFVALALHLASCAANIVTLTDRFTADPAPSVIDGRLYISTSHDLAAQRGWPIGIVDATPVGHTLRPVAADYPREDAIAEAQEFLRGRPYLRSDEIRTVGIQR